LLNFSFHSSKKNSKNKDNAWYYKTWTGLREVFGKRKVVNNELLENVNDLEDDYDSDQDEPHGISGDIKVHSDISQRNSSIKKMKRKEKK